jgi:hypothetical protein
VSLVWRMPRAVAAWTSGSKVVATARPMSSFPSMRQRWAGSGSATAGSAAVGVIAKAGSKRWMNQGPGATMPEHSIPELDVDDMLAIHDAVMTYFEGKTMFAKQLDAINVTGEGQPIISRWQSVVTCVPTTKRMRGVRARGSARVAVAVRLALPASG